MKNMKSACQFQLLIYIYRTKWQGSTGLATVKQKPWRGLLSFFSALGIQVHDIWIIYIKIAHTWRIQSLVYS